jgi:hypothetical protein
MKNRVVYSLLSAWMITCAATGSLYAQLQQRSDNPGWYRVAPLTDWERPCFQEVKTLTGGQTEALASRPEYNAANGITVDFRMRIERWPYEAWEDVAGAWWDNRATLTHTLFNKGWMWESALIAEGVMRFQITTTARSDAWFFHAHFIPEPGVWYHIVMTYHSGRIAAYVDGRPVGETTGVTGTIRQSSQPVQLGGGKFEGAIADFTVLDHGIADADARALSASMPASATAALHADLNAKLSTLPSGHPLRSEAAAFLALDPVPRREYALWQHRIAAASKGLSLPQNLISYAVPPLSGRPVLPWSLPEERFLSTGLSLTAAPGEYESASLVLTPLTDAAQLKITAGALHSEGNTLPANVIDLKLVKAHFQENTAWHYPFTWDRSTRHLTPELLVNDDALLQVDYAGFQQGVRLSFPGNTEYLSTVDNTLDSRQRWNYDKPFADMPIRDSAVFQPFPLKKMENRQVWVTVHPPQNTPAGLYTGHLTLDMGGQETTINLSVRVLPFTLDPPKCWFDRTRDFIPSIYYCSVYRKNAAGNYGLMLRDTATVRWEHEMMAACGLTHPGFYQFRSDQQLTLPETEETFAEMLRIREKAGISNRPLFFIASEQNFGFRTPTGSIELSLLRNAVNKLINWTQKYAGHRDIYVYGIDEAEAFGDNLLEGQQKAWELFHSLGVKVFVSTSDASGSKGMLAVAGKNLDIPIVGGIPSRERAERWRNIGSGIWRYGDPQSPVEDPERWRRHFGLPLYWCGYTGFAPYDLTDTYGNPWNDFDNTSDRDHNLIYPTSNGFIRTLAWEGLREAIDDIRYASKLLIRARAAARHEDHPDHLKAVEAVDFMENINFREWENLDDVRAKIIDYILAIDPVEESDDASLFVLTVNGIPATLKAGSNDTYEIAVSSKTASVMLEAVTNNRYATVRAGDLGKKPIDPDNMPNVFPIRVIAETGVFADYLLEVHRDDVSGLTDDMEQQAFVVYPNPVRQHTVLNIVMNRTYERLVVKLYDTGGKLLKKVSAQGQKIEIPVNGGAGTYLVSVEADHQAAITQKIVIR